MKSSHKHKHHRQEEDSAERPWANFDDSWDLPPEVVLDHLMSHANHSGLKAFWPTLPTHEIIRHHNWHHNLVKFVETQNPKNRIYKCACGQRYGRDALRKFNVEGWVVRLLSESECELLYYAIRKSKKSGSSDTSYQL